MHLFKKKRKKIGLALGSGGPRGLAHIGVIKALVKNNIQIDYIAGSSAGALIGGMYAKFNNIYKIEDYFDKLTYMDLLKMFSDPRFAHGILKGEKALKFLRSWLGKEKIESLPIPFKAVATDLITGQPVILNKGELALAIRTSASLPFFFKPIKMGKKILVDGGNSIPVPVELVRKMGADIVIAVDLNHCYIHGKNRPKNLEKLSMSEIAERALDILSYTMAKENCKGADIVINPDVYDIGVHRVVNGGEIIKEGERATLKMIEEIKSKM